MANQPFDPANPVYPEGCYAVPLPEFMIFREPNIESKSEMNFNKFMYFSKKKEGEAKEIVSDKTLREIIRSPESPWEDKLKGMVMIGPDGQVRPAHLPNLVDIVSNIDLVEVFKLLDTNNVTYNTNEIGEIIPIFLERIVDPKPKINIKGPVYPLTVRKIKSEFASYSDGFQVLYLHALVSEIILLACSGRYHAEPFVRNVDVSLESKYEVGEKAFELGSSVVMWNAHGMTRPCFKTNLEKIISVHKPMVFVILEARVYRESFEEVLKAFQYDINWSFDESVGLMGGIAVVWNEKKVKGEEFMVSYSRDCPLRLIGCLKAADDEAKDGAAHE